MQQFVRIMLVPVTALVLVSCGGTSAKSGKGDLDDKKAQLEKLKTQQKDVAAEIQKLQDEIIKLDPAAADNAKTKLVTIAAIATDTFKHYVDLQGKIDAENVAYVAPRGQGGVVRAVFVKEGSVVSQGQLILKLDDAILSQSVTAAQQQVSGIKAQLAQAQSIYERQQNLWKQNIGTEIQVLNAKTNVDALQSQLNAVQANVRLAQEQLNTTNVYAAISGVINTMNVKVGEVFAPGSMQIQIVNNSNLKVKVNVPENYLTRVKEGSLIQLSFPESNNKTITTRISVVGKLIDPNTRSFYIEARLPKDRDLRPNQLSIVRILDYTAPNVIAVPVNTIQNDETGKYVLVAVTENGKLVARKKAVEVGEIYHDKLEIKSGLQAGDKLITDGFQGLYDGQAITTDVK